MSKLFLALSLSTCLLSAQTKKIIYYGSDDALAREYQAASNKVKIVTASPANVMQEIVDADGFIGVITPRIFAAAKQLKWVGSNSAGVENQLFVPGAEPFRNSDVTLTSNRVVQGIEIADHAFALLLYTSRGLHIFQDHKRTETWQPKPYPGIELRGKTALIIGVGGIGSNIAIRAWAFGMHVIGVDPEDKPIVPYIDRMVHPQDLDDVIPLADVVFISTPDTAQSHKMFGAKEFELMKQKSYFVAVSRGGVYDMGGLVKALDSQKLAGAGVDVMDPEPLPKGHALWKFNNVMITPHIAGRSDHDAERMNGVMKENIARFGDGRPFINVIDKKKGY
ncbi:MAG TPA: D-2-hydroxyacid dehydrogenase [Bryobacteraceae bacterium]|nr:D-2-hydroxyacid dehydrogenase [Bryobacteraceae bacterium]